MGLILDHILLEVAVALVLFCWYIYYHITKNFDFWEKRGVPHRKGVFPFGSAKDIVLGKLSLGDFYYEVYKEFKGERYCGVYELHRPILVIRDPDLIKLIAVADFNHFVDRDPFPANRKEFLNNHLFLVGGDTWRNMRHKLSPAFTSGKMKNMFFLMQKCGENLDECLCKLTETNTSVNIKNVLARFTMDIIASCAFGAEINSLKDDNSEFFKTGISIFTPCLKTFARSVFINLFPVIAQIFKVENNKKKPKEMFHSLISNTVKFREENNISRNDFLDILIKLRHNKSILDGTEDDESVNEVSRESESKGLSLEEMTAQSFIFFIAGFETASSTMTFCLYELARHQEEQERLYQEIREVLRNHGGVTYQALQEMKYMDQVINETLRMYASLSVLHRRCTQTYKVPDSDLVIEKGQKVYIPTYAIHHDPKYYPNPYKFDPERFTPEKMKERHPYVHLPFGVGPRICVGQRFGMMQTKIGLTSFLKNFKVEECPETPSTISFLPRSFVTQSKTPIHLRVSRRI